MFLANTWEDYEVLDTGDGEKLERWGNVILRRPDPQTIWPKADPALWKQGQAHYHRSEKGGGEWEFLTRLPERWTIQHQDLRFYVRPTGFKHTGLFPEQAANWVWMGDLIRNSGRKDIRGEVWKLENELFGLVDTSAKVLSDKPLFFLINSYTTGFQASVLSNMLMKCVSSRHGGIIDAQELCLPVTTGGVLPCGASGRWSAK